MADNLVRFALASENSGTLQIKEASLIIKASEGAVLLSDGMTVETIPEVGVPYSDVQLGNGNNSATLPEVTLEPGERIVVVGYLRQRGNVPRIKVGWEGGGGELSKVEASPDSSPTVDRLVTSIVYNLIVAFAGPALIAPMGYAVGLSIGNNLLYREAVQNGVIAAGALLGALWQLYFLLRTVPSIRELVARIKIPTSRPSLILDGSNISVFTGNQVGHSESRDGA